MGWATTHFQFWVATLQVVSRQERHGVCNRRACAHDRVPVRTTEDVHAHDMGLGPRHGAGSTIGMALSQ